MEFDTSVLVAGGGPVGLTTALELNRHGIDAILIERNPSTTVHPKMDITNGRSMEIFRRLGVLDELREVAVPAHHQMSVVWVTSLSGHELARFDYPSVDDARKILRENNDGTMALEPPMRVSQVILEPVLKRALEERAPNIHVRFGWGLVTLEHDDDGVTATVKNSETGETKTIRSKYLIGCDGASSVTRKTLGIHLNSITPIDALQNKDPNNYLDSYRGDPENDPNKSDRRPPRYQIHFKSNDLELFEKFGGPSWHLQFPDSTTIIAQNDIDTWTAQIPFDTYPGIDEMDPKEALFEVVGARFDCEILVHNKWVPALCLADYFGKGRVWLAGDSVRQVIPSGGYGMNTGIGDAMAVAWMVAAKVQGWGGDKLLDAYETERRHVSARNRLASARHAGIRFQAMSADPGDVLLEDSPEGRAARKEYGEYILKLGNLENEAWGIEIGYRYDASPIICHEDGEAPAYAWEFYEPTSWPGGRPPNVFLSDGTPLFDHFGIGMTLLSFSDETTETLEAAAKAVGLPLKVVHIEDDHAAALYQCKLVLLRPDQHVAWRGDAAPSTEEAVQIIDLIRGA